MQKAFLFFTLILFHNLLCSQNKKEIDSINNLYIQGLNIPQDSIISLYERNINNAKKIKYAEGEADALSKISLAYGYQGKYDESAKYGLDAVKLYEKLGLSEKVAYRYAELGYSLKYRDIEKASLYMQRGKTIAESKNNEVVLKDIYNNYGVIKEIKNQLDSALYYYNKSLDIKQKIKDTIGIPYSYSNMAGVYGIQKNFEKAKEYFNLALIKRLQWKDSTTIAENYTQIGEVYLAEEKFDQAINWIHKSLPLSKAKQYQNLTQYNYKLLSDIYKTKKNTDSALHYFEQFSTIKDSIHSLKVEQSIAALTIEYETEKKENEILKQRTQLAEKEIEVKRKNTIIYGSLALAVLLGLIGFLFYNQQKLKNRQLKKEGELTTALAKIETQNHLQEQRLRISRDLHDNIGAQLTFIISSLDNIKYGFTDIGEKLENKLTGISQFTRQTIFELRDTIWAMNKNQITFEDLQARISNFIEQAKVASETTSFSFEIAAEVDKNHLFTSVEGMNIYRIIQEAVNNALKYADASEIKTIISKTPFKNAEALKNDEQFEIKVTDNGKGFDIAEIEMGNGLNNMKKRAREIDGQLFITSDLGEGTTVSLKIPT